MRAERVTVEWSYEQVKCHWNMAHNKNSTLKLEQDAEIVYAQIRVMFLLTNCFTCLRGNNISYHYGLETPSLEEYLSI